MAVPVSFLQLGFSFSKSSDIPEWHRQIPEVLGSPYEIGSRVKICLWSLKCWRKWKDDLTVNSVSLIAWPEGGKWKWRYLRESLQNQKAPRYVMWALEGDQACIELKGKGLHILLVTVFRRNSSRISRKWL